MGSVRYTGDDRRKAANRLRRIAKQSDLEEESKIKKWVGLGDDAMKSEAPGDKKKLPAAA